MKKFADFWRAMFFMVSTVVMGVMLYLTVVVWQPLWTVGFEDFGRISQAIEDLDRTAQPAVKVVPNMVLQMQQMNQSMLRMDGNVNEIKQAIVIQMSMLNAELNRMNNKFSPVGMMPFNW